MYPPLKSTSKSREHEWEADSDELDALDPSQSHHGLSASASASASSSSIPTITIQRPERDTASDAACSSHAGRESHEMVDDEEDEDEALTLRGGVLQGGLGDPLLKPARDIESHSPVRSGSLLSGVFNQTNSIIGAGIVGLPYAVQQAGFVTGLSLILFLGWVTDWTIRLIAINSKLAGGQQTYGDIVQVCYGHRGRIACAFFQFTFAFGGMAAFLVIIGDTIPHVLSTLMPNIASTPVGHVVFSRPLVVLIFTLAFCLPLSLLKDMHRLSAASGFALVQMAVILFVVVFHGPALPDSLKGQGEARWTVIEPGVPASIGVISFAYVCHHNSLLIFNSISTPTLDRFSSLTHYAVSISVAASALMAVSGYLTFGQDTLGNILNCFPTDDIPATVARLCFGLNMCTTFPLEAFVCREVLDSLFFRDAPESNARHTAMTGTLTLAALGLSLLTDDLGVVLEVAGGIGAAALAYVLPAACYLKLAPSITEKERLAAKACVGFGASVSLLVLVKTVWGAVQ